MTGTSEVIAKIRMWQHAYEEYPIPPASLLESRVMELERMGLEDVEDVPGEPSSVRQLAIASFHGKTSPYFVTSDDEILDRRDALEGRFGMTILSVQEAFMLLRESNDPPN